MKRHLVLPAMLLPALLAGCVSMPTGPSALVLPGTGKSFDQFRADDFSCRGYAQSQVGGTAQQAAADSTVRSAALGTVVGAALGAAVDGGRGAGTGAGVGLAMGTVSGAEAGNYAGNNLQRRYDYAYQQCMYAQGHRVPVSGRMMTESLPAGSYPPPNTPPPR
ncbi:MAG TPA: YMGG-like glycine zipper-containing protein [Burkholderiaceae bacterium]|nr:YMGG-like glycine zipper-containing protein [Burkholderiaceae bacterium]